MTFTLAGCEDGSCEPKYYSGYIVYDHKPVPLIAAQLGGIFKGLWIYETPSTGSPEWKPVYGNGTQMKAVRGNVTISDFRRGRDLARVLETDVDGPYVAICLANVEGCDRFRLSGPHTESPILIQPQSAVTLIGTLTSPQAGDPISVTLALNIETGQEASASFGLSQATLTVTSTKGQVCKYQIEQSDWKEQCWIDNNCGEKFDPEVPEEAYRAQRWCQEEVEDGSEDTSLVVSITVHLDYMRRHITDTTSCDLPLSNYAPVLGGCSRPNVLGVDPTMTDTGLFMVKGVTVDGDPPSENWFMGMTLFGKEVTVRFFLVVS